MVTVLNDMCNCEISTLHIQDDAFGCGQKNHLITFRGRILGNSNYSALGLIELMQTWIASGQAFVVVDSFRMQVDPLCLAQLDTINAPDCPLVYTITPAADTTRPSESSLTTLMGTVESAASTISSVGGVRVGEVGGIVVGVLILIVLIALVVLLGIILYRGR